jgi:hypothetical protein
MTTMRRATYLKHLELERNTMRLIGFSLEMVCINKLTAATLLELFFWYPFRHQIDVLSDAYNRKFARELLVNLVLMNLIYPNRAGLIFFL